MKTSGVCPKCGCTKLVGPTPAIRFSLPRLYTATLQALVCSECGYTEVYSDKLGLDNIRRLGKAYKVPQPRSSQSPQPPEHRVCLFCNTPIQFDEVICPECGKQHLG